MKKHRIGVLIVDSDPESRDHLNEILKVNSLVSAVDLAGDTDEALFRLIDISPDLILMEYPAPGKTGKELIGQKMRIQSLLLFRKPNSLLPLLSEMVYSII